MATDSERIDGLESQLAFQEETIQQLSDALIAQQKKIDLLQGMLEHLQSIQKEQSGELPAEEIPPHY